MEVVELEELMVSGDLNGLLSGCRVVKLFLLVRAWVFR